MKFYQKALSTTALVASAGLFGCKEKILEGTVMEEFGTANAMVELNKMLPESDSVVFKDMTYGFVIETSEGFYTVNVVEYRRKLLLELARKIDYGDKVRVINFGEVSFSDSYIEKSSNGKIGAVRSNAVSIIEKAKR